MNDPGGPRPRRFPVLLALAIVWLAATAWMRPLTLPDEGRYVGVAWEMLRSGDWLTPTLDGLPFFHKPPLFYWITAAAMALCGPHEWAGRLAPLLGGAAGVLAVGLFVRRWLGETTARASLLVLATQPLFYIGAQFANLDMLVAGCITVTIVLLAHVVLCADAGGGAPRALLGAHAAAALGVLAKGLIGLVLPALVMLAWLVATRRLRRAGALLSWRGGLLFLALVLPWFAAMQWRHPGFLHYFVVVQHVQRFAAGGFNNVQPFWFLPAVVLLLGLPWTPWLAAWRRRPPAADTAASRVRWLMALWAAVVIVFFSLPQSKLVGYVLPAVPPLAVLVAEGAASAVASARWRASAVLAPLLCVVVAAGLALVPAASSRRLGAELRARLQPGDAVLFAGSYFYDLPFYAGLRQPVPVVDDWADPDIARRDNWRKELVDAGRFAPDAGQAAMVDASRLAAGTCRRGTVWVLANSAAAVRYRLDTLGPRVASQGDTGLWRLAPGPLSDCRGMPNAD